MTGPPTPDGGFDAWATEQLAALRAADRWREVRSFDARGPVGRLGGREVVSFASNDYLGLSFHPAVIAAAHARSTAGAPAPPPAASSWARAPCTPNWRPN